MLEIIGFLVVTGALAYVTGIPIFFMYAGAWLGAYEMRWNDWLMLLVFLAPCVVGWWLWWEHIGSRINVSFG